MGRFAPVRAMELRPYQNKIIEDTRLEMRAGHKSILVQSPTGSGKTALTVSMLKSAAEKNMHSLFLNHRRELIRQSSKAFYKDNIGHGIIAAGFQPEARHAIQVASIQTLKNRMLKITRPDFIVWDECITGDSLIVTDVGTIPIKDVPATNAKYVLSFDKKPVWKAINGWRKTGKKKVFTVRLENGQFLRGTSNHPLWTPNGWRNIGQITRGEKILYCDPSKNSDCSERCLATVQSDIQIKEASRQESQQIIQRSKPNGRFIRQANFQGSTLKPVSLQMPKSPNQCNTSWETVQEICDSFEAFVYDISVKDTHCFFANGFLVHNCHHIAAGTWEAIFREFPDAFHVGLSATPIRLDGRGLGKYFSRMVQGPTVSWLIENKYLSPYKLFAPATISTAGMHTRMGEFVHDELVDVVSRPSVTGNAIAEYEKKCGDRRALGFAVSIEHSKFVVSQFNARGIPARHVDGDTPPDDRDRALDDFQAGKILVVFNCQLFGEGVDLPAVEGLIDLAPTLSLSATMQRWGRVLRTFEGKEHAMILDHAQNCLRHGLPDDDREWTLEFDGPRQKKDDIEIGVKICPKCFAAQKSTNAACAFCELIFKAKPREVDQIEGDLEEIDPETLRRRARQQQGSAQSEEELVALGIERGYKRPRLWARNILMARTKKNRNAA